MKHAIGRSLLIGMLTAAVCGLAQTTGILVACQAHHAWRRVRSGESEVVQDRGDGIARPGDAIFVCETPHTSGPIQWHVDLGCYCAPAAMSADALSTELGGTCRLDKAAPTRTDAWGACRYAHCGQHVDF